MFTSALSLTVTRYTPEVEQPRLNGDQYLAACLRTASTQDPGYYLHGLLGEITELLTAPREKWRSELGDVIWYYVAFTYFLDLKYRYDLTPIFPDNKIDPIYMYTYVGAGIRREDASAVEVLKTLGRISECYKKMVGHRKNQQVAIGPEVRALLFQLAGLASLCGVTLSEAAYENTEKLKLRYPDGFSYEASAARADGEK
jgi:hypothetical protein